MLAIVVESAAQLEYATQLAAQLALPLQRERGQLKHYLLVNDNGVGIQLDDLFYLPDLVGGRSGFRRAHGGGSKEPIARACGVKPGSRPTVLDGTGGWLRDAFVLASVGCEVTAIERHPIVYTLMQNALQRAKIDTETATIINRLQLKNAVTETVLQQLSASPQHDVIYLDPMFPPREKSAQVKKDMQVLQFLAEGDLGDSLLPLALAAAKKRVVVKRPDYAPPLANKKPSNVLESGGNRFDIYLV